MTSSLVLFKINTFDDGNQQFKDCSNTWIKTGSRFKGQKISLKNKVDNSIIIKSISYWKLTIITELHS
jgi:hypothetical protein